MEHNLKQISYAYKSLNQSQQGFITRFAPSPTGYLHLGHFFHLCLLYAVCEQPEQQIIFRIEDHDASRCRPEYVQALSEDAAALGFRDFSTRTRQSEHLDRYQLAFDALQRQNLVYPCSCTRKQLAERRSTAPVRASDVYDGHCRDRQLAGQSCDIVWRLRCEAFRFSWQDCFQGPQTQELAAGSGDFPVRDRDGQWTYQFAVVVDDLFENIGLILRGEDLLHATVSQEYLKTLLDPDYKPAAIGHHGLLRDTGGKKLSKRSLAASVRGMLRDGQTPAEILSSALAAGGIRCPLPISTIDEFRAVVQDG